MDKCKIAIYGIVLSFGFFTYAPSMLRAKASAIGLPGGFSLSSPVIFDKETLSAQIKKEPHTLLLQESKQVSKADCKRLKKELNALSSKKDAKSMSLKELREAADLAIKLGWYDKALLYLQQMLLTAKSSELIRQVKLEIADLLFEQGLLKKAEAAFQEYLELYPGSGQAEYAHYKRVLCLFYQTLKIDQDQTPTRETLQLAEAYLEKGLAYKQYRPEIAEIKKHCHFMLYQSEVNVFNFYMKKKSYGAASGRLAYLKQQYLPKLPALEPNVVMLECRLAQAQGDKELYQERLAYLHKKFPQHGQPTRVAHAKQRSYTTRF